MTKRSVESTPPGSTFATPVNGGPVDMDTIRHNQNKTAAFADDHHASHWPFSLSAPKIGGDGGLAGVATTGGSLTADQEHFGRATFLTPNGETARSAEMSVVLDSAENAWQITVPPVDARFTPALYWYKVPAADVSEDPAYRCRAADLALVSGDGAAVEDDGLVTLSTTEPTVFLIVGDPPNTEPEPPVAADTSGIDPLTLSLFGVAVTGDDPVDDGTHTTKTLTYMLPNGATFVEVGVYDNATSRMVMKEIRAGGLTVARYAFTWKASGELDEVTPVEV